MKKIILKFFLGLFILFGFSNFSFGYTVLDTSGNDVNHLGFGEGKIIVGTSSDSYIYDILTDTYITGTSFGVDNFSNIDNGYFFGGLSVTNDYYYCDISFDCSTFSISGIDSIFNGYLIDGNFYYRGDSGNGQSFYKYNLDTGNNSLISSDRPIGFFLKGNFLYFTNISNGDLYSYNLNDGVTTNIGFDYGSFYNSNFFDSNFLNLISGNIYNNSIDSGISELFLDLSNSIGNEFYYYEGNFYFFELGNSNLYGLEFLDYPGTPGGNGGTGGDVQYNESLLGASVGKIDYYFQSSLNNGYFFQLEGQDENENYFARVFNSTYGSIKENSRIFYNGQENAYKTFFSFYNKSFVYLVGGNSNGLNSSLQLVTYNGEKNYFEKRTLFTPGFDKEILNINVAVYNYEIIFFIETQYGVEKYSYNYYTHSLKDYTGNINFDGTYNLIGNGEQLKIFKKNGFIYSTDDGLPFYTFFNDGTSNITEGTSLLEKPFHWDFTSPSNDNVYVVVGEETNENGDFATLHQTNSGTLVIDSEYFKTYVNGGDIWKLYNKDVMGFDWDNGYVPLVSFIYISDGQFSYNYVLNGNFYTTETQVNGPEVIGGLGTLGGTGETVGEYDFINESPECSYTGDDNGFFGFFSNLSCWVQSMIDNIFNAYENFKNLFNVFGEIGNVNEKKELYNLYFNSESLIGFSKTHAQTYEYNENENVLGIISEGSFEEIPLLNNIYNLVKYSLLFFIGIMLILYFFNTKQKDE